MANVSQWDNAAANNNDTPPDGWPEGQAPSTVNDCAREMQAAISRWYDDQKGELVTEVSFRAMPTGSRAAYHKFTLTETDFALLKAAGAK